MRCSTRGFAMSEAPTAVATGGEPVIDAPRSLARAAWYDLKRSRIFWLASAIALLMVAMAAFPPLFSSIDARTAPCSLDHSMRLPDAEHWFGFTKQGCDVYARVVYGARSSILVGLFSTLLSGITALTIGMLAGYYGRWVDGLLARIMDVFLGIHPLLGAIVVAKAL